MKLYIKPANMYVMSDVTRTAPTRKKLITPQITTQSAPAAASPTASSRRPIITANIGSAKYILRSA